MRKSYKSTHYSVISYGLCIAVATTIISIGCATNRIDPAQSGGLTDFINVENSATSLENSTDAFCDVLINQEIGATSELTTPHHIYNIEQDLKNDLESHHYYDALEKLELAFQASVMSGADVLVFADALGQIFTTPDERWLLIDYFSRRLSSSQKDVSTLQKHQHYQNYQKYLYLLGRQYFELSALLSRPRIAMSYSSRLTPDALQEYGIKTYKRLIGEDSLSNLDISLAVSVARTLAEHEQWHAVLDIYDGIDASGEICGIDLFIQATALYYVDRIDESIETYNVFHRSHNYSIQSARMIAEQLLLFDNYDAAHQYIIALYNSSSSEHVFWAYGILFKRLAQLSESSSIIFELIDDFIHRVAVNEEQAAHFAYMQARSFDCWQSATYIHQYMPRLGLFEQASDHFKAGNAEVANSLFDRYISNHPRRLDAKLAVANFYWDASEWELALSAYNKILSIDKNHISALMRRTQLYFLVERPNDAMDSIQHLESILPHDENSVDDWHQIIEFLWQYGYHEYAVKIMHKMVAWESSYRNLYFYRIASVEYVELDQHHRLDYIFRLRDTEGVPTSDLISFLIEYDDYWAIESLIRDESLAGNFDGLFRALRDNTSLFSRQDMLPQIAHWVSLIINSNPLHHADFAGWFGAQLIDSELRDVAPEYLNLAIEYGAQKYQIDLAYIHLLDGNIDLGLHLAVDYLLSLPIGGRIRATVEFEQRIIAITDTDILAKFQALVNASTVND